MQFDDRRAAKALSFAAAAAMVSLTAWLLTIIVQDPAKTPAWALGAWGVLWAVACVVVALVASLVHQRVVLFAALALGGSVLLAVALDGNRQEARAS